MRRKELLILTALLVCLFIYLFYRTERTIVNELAIRLTSPAYFATLRAQVATLLPLNDLVIYSLPEGLWIMCITLTSKMYYLRLFRWDIDCKYIPIVLCIVLELMQFFHVLNGRFDIMDILVSLFFWLLGCTFFSEKKQRQNICSKVNVQMVQCVASYSIIYLAHVQR